MSMIRSHLSPLFTNGSEKQAASLGLIHDKKLCAVNELRPMLQEITCAGKPLLIIAEDIDQSAASVLRRQFALRSAGSISRQAPRAVASRKPRTRHVELHRRVATHRKEIPIRVPRPPAVPAS